MSEHRQVAETHPDPQGRRQAEPVAMDEQVSNQSPSGALPGNLLGSADDASIRTQAAHLGDARLHSAQRQAMAAQIAEVHGNQHLLRVMRQITRSTAQTSFTAASPHVAREAAVEVVRPTLHPPTKSEAPEQPVGDRVMPKTAAEAKTATMAPIQTEDEKINFLTATTPTLNDLAPTDSSGLTQISLSDVAIQGEVYEDGGQWKIRVTAASTTIHWGINTSGYEVPNPTDGGNITRANWETVIRELEGYQTRQASGSWHDPAATRAHELNHVAWYRGEIIRTWPDIETRIQSHTLGATRSMTRAQAETAMATYLNGERRNWFNAYGVAPEAPAYAAGQAVLNQVIERIRAYARSQGWT